jgi:hypothetical protein
MDTFVCTTVRWHNCRGIMWRDRNCATVDYWVNALDGQPFVYINQEIDHGLVQALDKDIVPWVEKHAPITAEHQQRMDREALTPRFTVSFDREGYSPDLFEEWQQRRIAVLSYHRYPAEDWGERRVPTADGELGERRNGAVAVGGTRHTITQGIVDS